MRSTSSQDQLNRARREAAAQRANSGGKINPSDIADRYRGTELSGRRLGATKGANGHASKLPTLSGKRGAPSVSAAPSAGTPTGSSSKAARIQAVRDEMARNSAAARTQAARDKAAASAKGTVSINGATSTKGVAAGKNAAGNRPASDAATAERVRQARIKYEDRINAALANGTAGPGKRPGAGKGGNGFAPGDTVAVGDVRPTPTSAARPSATVPAANNFNGNGGIFVGNSGAGYYSNCYWNYWSSWGCNNYCGWFISPFYTCGYYWQNYWSFGGTWGGRNRFRNSAWNNCYWYGPFLPTTYSVVRYVDPDPEPEIIYVEVPVEPEVELLPEEAAPAPAIPQGTDPGLQRELNRASAYYLTQGDRAFRETRYGDAAHFYAKAVEFAPDSGILYLVLSDALFATGDYRYAAYALRQAYDKEPDLATNVIDKREFYAEPSDFDRQLAILERYVTDHMLDMDARFVLAANYLFGGRPAAAVDLLENPFSEELAGTPEGRLLLDVARQVQYGPPADAAAPAAPAGPQ